MSFFDGGLHMAGQETGHFSHFLAVPPRKAARWLSDISGLSRNQKSNSAQLSPLWFALKLQLPSVVAGLSVLSVALWQPPPTADPQASASTAGFPDSIVLCLPH